MIMLRISIIKETRSVVILKIEGRLVSEWVSLLEKECSRWMHHNRERLLDLEEVTYVDTSGLTLLRRLTRSSWKVSRCSSFVRQLLQ